MRVLGWLWGWALCAPLAVVTGVLSVNEAFHESITEVEETIVRWTTRD